MIGKNQNQVRPHCPLIQLVSRAIGVGLEIQGLELIELCVDLIELIEVIGTKVLTPRGAGDLFQALLIEWCFTGFGGITDDYLGWYIDDVLVTGLSASEVITLKDLTNGCGQANP